MSMKKRVLCAFFLALYLLTASTILSFKIEEEMRPLVQVTTRTSSKVTGRTMQVGIRAIFQDGQDHLMEMREGAGWESGMRAYEVYGYGMNIPDGVATLYGVRDYTFITSASRIPQEGELVRVVEKFEKVNDVYLYYYDKSDPPVDQEFPTYATIIGVSDRAILMDMENVEDPFLPHTAKTWTVGTDMSDKIFSFMEVERFFRELPKVAKVPVILLLGIAVWIVSCVLSLRAEDNKVLLWMNGVLAVLSLGYLQYVLGTIDLPASLLPRDSILDFNTYRETFGLFFTSLEPFAQESARFLALKAETFGQIKGIFRGGVLLGAAVTVMEAAISWLTKRHYKKQNDCQTNCDGYPK